MKRGPRRGRLASALVATLLLLGACASSPRRESPAPRDRTEDPEFVAAAQAAEREFETQADALAAGVYEPFVHPDSVRPAASPSVRAPGAPAAEFGPEDPSTEELLGTLRGGDAYHPMREPLDEAAIRDRGAATWTLQVGAFDAETGALVRLRQLARDFPDLPRWHRPESGLFRVYLGRFSDRGEADRLLALVVERGYADAWVLRTP